MTTSTVTLQTPQLNRQLQNRLTQTYLDVIILRKLASEPAHSYRLLKYIEENFGYRPPDGTMYKLIKKLQQQGLLTSRRLPDKRKVEYALTRQGEVYAREFSLFEPTRLHTPLQLVFKGGQTP